jgi:hypothetical protein
MKWSYIMKNYAVVPFQVLRNEMIISVTYMLLSETITMYPVLVVTTKNQSNDISEFNVVYLTRFSFKIHREDAKALRNAKKCKVFLSDSLRLSRLCGKNSKHNHHYYTALLK